MNSALTNVLIIDHDSRATRSEYAGRRLEFSVEAA